MSDKIIENYDWSTHVPANKGQSKYAHLWDGKTRKLDMRDYGHTVIENFRISVNAAARNKGFYSRTRTIDEYHLMFQVTGKR